MLKKIKNVEKVSDVIIGQIRDMVLSGEVSLGDKIGFEKELIRDFGVSKASVREALRVLESMGIVETRKGKNGGIFVADTAVRTNIAEILNIYGFQDIPIKEITMLRYFIEPNIAQIAASKITKKDIHQLQKIIDETILYANKEISMGISFHRYLVRMTENSLLIMAIDFIDYHLKVLIDKLGMGADYYKNVKKWHEIILECLIQKDPIAARIAIINGLLQVGRDISARDNSPAFDPRELKNTQKNSYLQLSPEYEGVIVYEGDPMLNNSGILLRRVGASKLFVVMPEEKNSSKLR